jgi:excisionase family DNA binding protein
LTTARRCGKARLLGVKRLGRPRKNADVPAAHVDEIMTAGDVAHYLLCDVVTIYRLIKKGEISCFRVGSNCRFWRSQVDSWITGREMKPRNGRPSKGRPRKMR